MCFVLKIDLGEGQFALRVFSNGRYLRVNPPALGEEEAVWFLEVSAIFCRSKIAESV